MATDEERMQKSEADMQELKDSVQKLVTSQQQLVTSMQDHDTSIKGLEPFCARVYGDFLKNQWRNFKPNRKPALQPTTETKDRGSFYCHNHYRDNWEEQPNFHWPMKMVFPCFSSDETIEWLDWVVQFFAYQQMVVDTEGVSDGWPNCDPGHKPVHTTPSPPTSTKINSKTPRRTTVGQICTNPAAPLESTTMCGIPPSKAASQTSRAAPSATEIHGTVLLRMCS